MDQASPQNPADSNRAPENRPAQVNVDVTNHDMRVIVHLTPPVGDGDHVTLESLGAALTAKGVTYGIDRAALNRIVAEKLYGRAITVANGTPPQNGVDAQLVFHYDRPVVKQDRSLDNMGRIDYHELNKIINTDADQRLLEKIPATEGQPGKTVKGRDVKQIVGRDLLIRAGGGVRKSDDGCQWFSTVSGQVLFRNNQLRVENVLRLDDVNAETGNVRFRGTVIVNGVVEDGFTVESAAGVQVLGSVGGAKIIAVGDVSILGGIFGKNHAEILSTEGSIIARFSQDARLVAAADIIIDEYAKNSQLRAGNIIQLQNENKTRGRLLGGTASAGRAVYCNNVGSELEIRTRVMVGISKEDLDRIGQLEKLAATRLDQLDNLQKSLLLLERENQAAHGKLDEHKREIYAKLLGGLTRLRVDAQSGIAELSDLYRAAAGEKKGFLHVEGRLHPNVEVHIRLAVLEVKKAIDFCTLTNSEGEIGILPFKGRTENDDA